MSNSYYVHATFPAPNSPGSSASMRNELELITDGFDKLPTLSGNGYKVAIVNAGGTALIASNALQGLTITTSTLTSNTITGNTITGGSINNTPIGASTASSGAFTTLTASSTVNLGSSVTLGGGAINNTTIGATTPSTGAFTTLSANSGITGNLTGNVTGNLTGNVTGNVTGNLTGNVTSSGSSTFSNVTITGSLDMDAGTTATITNLSAPVNNGDAATKLYVDTADALKVAKAGDTMSGDLNMGSNTVTGLKAPSANSDAATKTYVDTADDTKVAKAGSTMSGDLNMGSNTVTGLKAPSANSDAATKTYVDTADGTKLSLGGGTMTGAIAMGSNKITGLSDPNDAGDAANKGYVDNAVQGLDAKASVRVATTANITLSTEQTIDGVAVVAGDRVLVKNQTDAEENGIYVASATAWSRASDANTWAELVSAFVFVESGTAGGDNGFVCTVDAGGTLGTTDVTWVQFSGAGQITAGAGMTKSGNTLNVATADTGRIVVNADSIDLAGSIVTAGTYRSVTVDEYGRVTAGTTPTTISGYGISDAYTKSEVDTAVAQRLALAGGTMTGAIAMGSNKITGLGTPAATDDAATKGYADSLVSGFLSTSGGTMSGAIAMGSSKITGLAAPTDANDAATKTYVDTADGTKLSLAGGTMTGGIAMGSNTITGLPTPTAADEAVRKDYVDAVAGSATAAAASATAAATSATDAAASATTAATSETNAASSETNAATSATNASNSASAAATSASNASSAASSASTSASNASTYATNASTSASNASTSASNAATSATNAATSETNAASSATAAANYPRVTSYTTTTSITPNFATTDMYILTALASNITINAATGMSDGDKLLFRFLDNGTARTITWNAVYVDANASKPVATVSTKTTYVGMVYNAGLSRWDVIAVIQE